MATPPPVPNVPPPGPCDWGDITTCVPELLDFPQAVINLSRDLAVFVLDAFTGHQFGQCPLTVRPCGPACGNMLGGYATWPVGGPSPSSPNPWMVPYIVNGSWRNCGCGGGCQCAPACRVELNGPVAQLDEVKVDGLVLDGSAYAMVGKWLARTDGGPCWPSCQDPAVPDTEVGTFSVTYQPGRMLPDSGRHAAGLLAYEFAKACAGGTCDLPGQLRSLTRQGVEIEMVAPEDVLSAGRTGIRQVDLWIEAVNPSGLRSRSKVFSPDLREHPRRYLTT